MAKAKAPRKNTNGKEIVATPVVAEAPMAAAPTLVTNATKTETKAARKPEAAATEARANLASINLDEQIRQLAYLLSERRGFAPGHETEDWLSAEHEVRQRNHQPRI